METPQRSHLFDVSMMAILLSGGSLLAFRVEGKRGEQRVDRWSGILMQTSANHNERSTSSSKASSRAYPTS